MVVKREISKGRKDVGLTTLILTGENEKSSDRVRPKKTSLINSRRLR